MKKNGVFLFVISHLVPEIFKIFVLCKIGTDDVIRCDNMEVKTQNREYLLRNAPDGVYFDVALATHPVPDCYYAGMVNPVFDLEQTLSTSSRLIRRASAIWALHMLKMG